MKAFYRLATAIVFTVILSGFVFTATNSEAIAEQTEQPKFLFTISATSGSFKDGQLTLNGVPLVVYFSDRPDRIAGHISLQDFATMWAEGADSFAMDAPNAQLSLLGQTPENPAVLTISNLNINGTSVSFSVKTLEGSLPKTFGPATLFLDDTPTCPPGVNPQCTD